MKKTAFISLLGVALLLTGCDADLTRVKKPTFASFGNEVAFEDFQEDVSKAFEDTDLHQEALLGSKEFKIKSNSASNETLYRYDSDAANYKVVRQNIHGSLLETALKYDSKKLISLVENKQKTVDIVKSKTEDTKEETTNEVNSGSAVVTIDSGKSVISFNNKAMTYSVTKSFGEGEEPAEYFDSSLKASFRITIELLFAINLPTSAEYTPEKYHFYQNKNTYTLTYAENVKEDLKDFGNVIYAHSVNEIKNTVQVEVSENKQVLTYYSSISESIDYLRDYENAHANERSIVTFQESYEISLKSKNVSLSNIKLSKYTEIE